MLLPCSVLLQGLPLDNFRKLWYNTVNGALAQLGAHHTGSVGVRGSNPLCSTNEKSLCLAENIGFIIFCYASEN